MYKLYVEREGEESCVKEGSYRRIFQTEYNLSFQKPKKDSCLQCEKHKRGLITAEAYQAHIDRKIKSRGHKQKDKERVQNDPTFYSAAFDMQQVLSTPSATTSTIFYKRKLSSYNLSMYSNGSGAGTCYLWDEINGKRGANEIGTCLYIHINSLPPNINHVSLYSDTCGGQNRNKYIAATLV